MSHLTSAADSVTPLGLTLRVASIGLSDEQFLRLCQDNPELRLELTPNRELIIMSPTGAKTGLRNSRLNQRLANWAEQDGSGLTFDSSTGFTLPSGAKRSPDGAWLKLERWEALSEEQQETFAPVCPDFVIELRSPQDELPGLAAKMAEYIESGARLGWLIDPIEQKVHVYRSDGTVQILERPARLTAEPVLRGFELDLDGIW